MILQSNTAQLNQMAELWILCHAKIALSPHNKYRTLRHIMLCAFKIHLFNGEKVNIVVIWWGADVTESSTDRTKISWHNKHCRYIEHRKIH